MSTSCAMWGVRGDVWELHARSSGDRRESPFATASFVASTDGEAADGDILDQTSWRLDAYRANPVILDNHDLTAVVGRATDVRVAGDPPRLLVDVQWDTAEVNPRGQLVAHQHTEGYRSAVSVRWRSARSIPRNKLPNDDPRYSTGTTIITPWGEYERVGRVLSDNTLLEVSSVSVPGDPAALQYRAPYRAPDAELVDLLGASDDGARRALEEMVRSAAVSPSVVSDERYVAAIRDIVLSLVRSDREVRIALRALGLSEPIRPPTDLELLLKEG